MKRISFLLLLVLIAGCEEPGTDVARLQAGAVRIVAEESSDGPRRVTGSGFVVTGQGHVATAWRVVEEVESILVLRSGENPGQPVPATVLWHSAVSDLAILEASGLSRPPNLVAETTPEGGADLFLLGYNVAECCSVGSPDPDIRPGSFGRTVSLSRRGGGEPLPVIMHSIEIAPSQRGGALLDSCGAVVGVASLDLDPSEAPPAGIWFGSTAISLREALDSLGLDYTLVRQPCRDG